MNFSSCRRLALLFSLTASAFAHGEGSRAERLLASIIDPEDRAVLVAAHRGGYARDREHRAPENSVANVAVAIAAGFDLYETDIRRTRDGVFVVVHDDKLDRETDGTGPVEALTLAEVKRLKKRYRDGTLSVESVATLEELLVAGRGRILFKADPKPGVMKHFEELAALVDRLGMSGQVFLRVGLKEADPIADAFAAGAPRLELMFKVDHAEQVNRMADRFELRTIQINHEKGESLGEEKRRAIQAALARGLLVQTHAYGEESEWRQLAEAGVRMFHSAAPGPTLKWLKENDWRDRLSRD